MQSQILLQHKKAETSAFSEIPELLLSQFSDWKRLPFKSHLLALSSCISCCRRVNSRCWWLTLTLNKQPLNAFLPWKQQWPTFELQQNFYEPNLNSLPLLHFSLLLYNKCAGFLQCSLHFLLLTQQKRITKTKKSLCVICGGSVAVEGDTTRVPQASHQIWRQLNN